MDTKTSLATKICLTEEVSSIKIRYHGEINSEGLELKKIEIISLPSMFDGKALADYKTKYNATITYCANTKLSKFMLIKITINPNSLQEGSQEKACVEKAKRDIIEKLSSAIK